MAELVKIPYEGTFVDAEQVDVQVPGPFSHKVELPDGKVLNMDMIINNFFRLVDKKDAVGEPIYVLNVQIKVTKAADSQNVTLTEETK